MPARNVVRNFVKDEIYHVYNRGLGKMEVFLNSEDYNLFLYYLSAYLLPEEKTLQKYPKTPSRIYKKSLHNELELLGYCLMPNHFHLLFKISANSAIPKLMKQLNNAYTSYFNKKYQHAGPLFQGKYKAVKIPQEQIKDLIRFIHLNPTTNFLVNNPKDYRWSSHTEYIKQEAMICNLGLIGDYFSSIKEFESFVLDQRGYSDSLVSIKDLTLEG